MRGVRTVVGQETRLYNQCRKEHQMDDRRFDRLTRQVGQQTDRRAMFKTAAGGALSLVGLTALTGAVPRPKAASRAAGVLPLPTAGTASSVRV